MNNKEILSKLINRFISSVINKQNNESEVIYVALEQIKSNQNEYFKKFNKIQSVKIQNQKYQVSRKIDSHQEKFNDLNNNNQSITKIKKINHSRKYDQNFESNFSILDYNVNLIDKNNYKEKNAQNINEIIDSTVDFSEAKKIKLNSISNNDKNINDNLSLKDQQNLIQKVSDNENIEIQYNENFRIKIFEIFNSLCRHRDFKLFNDVSNITFSKLSFDDVTQNENEFRKQNLIKTSLSLNLSQMTLFFINQTKFIQTENGEQYENNFFQQNIDFIFNSGIKEKMTSVELTPVKTNEFKLFSNKENKFQSKILCKYYKYCNIIYDERQQSSTLSLNSLFYIVEIPLNSCKIFAFAIKDMDMFKTYLRQSNCPKSRIQYFEDLYQENPCSIYVQLPLLQQYRHIIKQRVNLKLFQEKDKEELQKYIIDKQINIFYYGPPQKFRETFQYLHFIEKDYNFRRSRITLNQNNSKQDDKLLRFLEHIRIAHLVQSVDQSEVMKIIKKFTKVDFIDNFGFDAKYQENMYKRIFGRCILQFNKKRSEIMNQKEPINMSNMIEEFKEMEKLHQLFFPSCFHLVYNGLSTINLFGGQKTLSNDLTRPSLKENGQLIFKFNIDFKDEKIQFIKLFKQFQINALNSIQFSKEELKTILDLIKTVEHLNESFLSFISWQEARPDYFSAIDKKSKKILYNNYSNTQQKSQLN